MIKNVCHHILKYVCRKNHHLFLRALKNPEKAQRDILFRLTGVSSYEKFKFHFPVTTYSEWKSMVEERREKEKGRTHFVPTSGSTQKIKWIPYTESFKTELWQATAPWIYDIYQRHPGIKRGTHFWSLSWLPEEMREEHQSNDLDFFAGLEKNLLEKVMTMDESAATASSLEESMRIALLSLLTKKVTLISIWSPTFLLELLDFMLKEKKYFLSHTSGKIKATLEKHEVLSPRLTKDLFPHLVMISSWATSTSEYYAEKLKDLFPHAKFEAKGLWATEGVVTIPYNGKFPVAINSHFYEFIVEGTSDVLPLWKLEKGMRVTPVLTTGSGFFRYKLNDLLLVEDFIEKTPCLKFLGRINEVDLVGEKISAELAQNLLSTVSNEFGIKAITLLAFLEPHAHYQLLIDGDDPLLFKEKIQNRMEELLQQNFHYKLARELHQLSACEVRFANKAMDEYLSYSEKQVQIRGNIKLEPLLLVKGSKHEGI